MAPRARSGVASVLLLLVLGSRASAQTLQIGIIDFYGLGRLSVADVRQTLTFKEGDSISFAGDARPAFLVEAERRLAALPGVIRASVNPVCCDAGRVIVYVGLEQQGQPVTRFRDNPTGTVRLPADVLQAARDFEEAQKAAVMRGDVGEDDSRGHTLMHDAAARAIQERFVGYAARDLKALTRVLRESSDAGQRAIAAEVLGYAPVKQDVVPDLVLRDAGRLAGCPQQRHARALRVHRDGSVQVTVTRADPLRSFYRIAQLAGVDRPEQVVIRAPRSVGGARPEAARGASTRGPDVARRDGAMEE